jgi:hypothetical protein
MLHDIAAYDLAFRPAVAKGYGLTYGFGVRAIAPESSGARAGLERNDEIVAVNGQDMKDFASQVVGNEASYDRTERFVTFMAGELAKGPARLTVRRGDAMVTLTLVGEAGCGGRFTVAPGRDLNAWADGEYVAVTTRMMRYAKNDDELAFVVAHEMSHNILHHDEHANGASGLLAELGFGARGIKADETAADAYAVRLLAAAGYDLSAPERFLRRTTKFRWLDLATTHPGVGRRVAIVRNAIVQMNAGRPTNAPLPLRLAAAAHGGRVAPRLVLSSFAFDRQPQWRSAVPGLATIDLAAPFDRRPSSPALDAWGQRPEAALAVTVDAVGLPLAMPIRTDLQAWTIAPRLAPHAPTRLGRNDYGGAFTRRHSENALPG